MKKHAFILDGLVVEIIEAVTDLAGVVVPLAERFTPDFVAAMVDITSLSVKPGIGWLYDGAVFIAPAQQSAAEVLAAARATGLARIAEYSKSKRAQIAGTTDNGEIAGWTYKLQIAQAIGAGTATVGEIAAFQAEINARAISGETLAKFCAKVLGNAAFYAQAVGLIDGVKRRAQDAVHAATTPDQVDAALTAAKLQAEAAFAALMQGAAA